MKSICKSSIYSYTPVHVYMTTSLAFACTYIFLLFLKPIGSYEPPLTQWLMEVTPREGEDNSGDDRLKEILADALKESPSHDHFYTGL